MPLFIFSKKGIYLLNALMISVCSIQQDVIAATLPGNVSIPFPEFNQTGSTIPTPVNISSKTPEVFSADKLLRDPVVRQEQTPPTVEKGLTSGTLPPQEIALKNTPSDDVIVENASAVDIAPPPIDMLESEEQKRAYASGIMLAHFIEEQLARQKSLHITLNKNILLAGIADTFRHQIKMSDEDVKNTMIAFDEQIKLLAQAQTDKKQAEDNSYIEAFAQRKDVKKNKRGLLYSIDNKGEGALLKDTDIILVDYEGTLVDGTVVDAPKVDNAKEIFRVANMPPVLRDSVKLIRKGGHITVVVPPATLEKTKDANGELPLDTVVIYTISVVDVNPPQ